MQSPALAEDPLAEALKRKQELERAVQVSRANAERYKQAPSSLVMSGSLKARLVPAKGGKGDVTLEVRF